MHDDEFDEDHRELARDSIASGDGAPIITTAEALFVLLAANSTRRGAAYPMHDCGPEPCALGSLAVCEFTDASLDGAWRSTILAWIAEDCPARELIDIAYRHKVAIFPNGQRLLCRWPFLVWQLEEPAPPRYRRPRGAWANVYPPRLH